MKDNFSTQAKGYATFRPGYPAQLFEFIFSKTKGNDLAWDCGTGNGQTAIGLSKHFLKVYASDISEKQLEHAKQHDRITYAVEPAEKTSLATNTVDLVTISQALHWFDLEGFYAEVKRVCKPNAMIAAWTYQLLEVDHAGINELIYNFYTDILGQYWDHERRLVDEGYKTIYFPFSEIETPGFSINTTWQLSELEGFLKTWSAVQKFISANGYDPVDELIITLRDSWNPNEQKKITFPVCLKMAYVHGILQDF